MIREIGTRARPEVESLLGRPVFLELGQGTAEVAPGRGRARDGSGSNDRGVEDGVSGHPTNSRRGSRAISTSAPRRRRAVRVGEKETSEQAAIVARYADLFTREQHAALRRGRGRGTGRGPRAALPAARGLRGRHRRQRAGRESDELENAMLAAASRVPRRVAAAPLGAGAARDSRRLRGARRARGAGRGRVGRLQLSSATRCSRRQRRSTPSSRPIPTRSRVAPRGRTIDLHALAEALASAVRRRTTSGRRFGEEWLDRILGAERDAEPASYHVAYLRRMSPLAASCTRRTAACPSAWRPWRASGSTWPRTRASGSTSTTGRRRARAPA